jgi:hypothetical protein
MSGGVDARHTPGQMKELAGGFCCKLTVGPLIDQAVYFITSRATGFK